MLVVVPIDQFAELLGALVALLAALVKFIEFVRAHVGV
jgi:hypothetical protein